MLKEPLQIDVEKIVRSHTTRRVPRCLINWLARLIHQDEINTFLRTEGRVEGYPFFQAVLDLVHCTDSIEGLDNLRALPSEQRLIFVSNHPLGALEAMALGKELGAVYGDKINFVVNDLLMYLRPLQQFFTPVNVVTARQDKQVGACIEQLFASDKQVVMFPAGACSRRQHGVITDLPWKKMFITKARQYGRSVVPIYCHGRNSERFYRVAALRKRLGFKLNLEMLLLPDEMFRQRGRNIHITIGKVINANRFDSSRSDIFWADCVRQVVYQLKTNSSRTGF